MLVRVTTTDRLLLELWDLMNRSVYFPSAMWYNSGNKHWLKIYLKLIYYVNLESCTSQIVWHDIYSSGKQMFRMLILQK